MTSFRQKYLDDTRRRQANFRENMKKKGYRQVTLWLDEDTLKIIGDRTGKELSKFICDAIKGVNKSKYVVKNNVTCNDKNNVMNKRYMSTELENKILELRDNGLSLNEISNRLAQEGFISITGKPYSTATIYKAEKRARQRRD